MIVVLEKRFLYRIIAYFSSEFYLFAKDFIVAFRIIVYNIRLLIFYLIYSLILLLCVNYYIYKEE